MKTQLHEAVEALKHGGIIAYPTEAIYGLGCDPFMSEAVERLYQLKQRPDDKGFILLVANWEQVEHCAELSEEILLEEIKTTWPGPVTWVFPAKKELPDRLCGQNHAIALRMTNHLIARELCIALDSPIVSSSANHANTVPAQTAKEVKNIFGNTLDYILEGELGGLDRPTEIRNALNGMVLRKG